MQVRGKERRGRGTVAYCVMSVAIHRKGNIVVRFVAYCVISVAIQRKGNIVLRFVAYCVISVAIQR